MIQQIEKAYDEVEKNRPPTHTKIFCATQGVLIVQKLSIKQSAKVIFRFDRLRTAHSKRQNKPYEHWKSYWPPTHLII